MSNQPPVKNKDIDERRLLLQTLGLKVFVRVKAGNVLGMLPSGINFGDTVELLNWDERCGNVYVKIWNGKKFWIAGDVFEKL